MFNHSPSIGCISESLRFTLGNLPILKQHSSNIERRNSQNEKDQSNSNNTCSTIPPKMDNGSINLEEVVFVPNVYNYPKQGTSVDISIIDERDDLLLSSTTIKSQKIMDEQLKMCQQHDKVLDIVCLVEKTKICCYCALFGHHKDHNFKSEQQLREELDKKSKQLEEMGEHFLKVKKELSQGKELIVIEEIYKQKRSVNLNEIEEQYEQVIKKLNETKIQLQRKITEDYDAKLKMIKEAWKQCQLNLTNEKLFQDWKGYGQQVLSSFKGVVHTNAIADFCNAYQQFPWNKGELLIKDVIHKREQFVKTWKYQLSHMDSNKCSFKNIYLSNMNIDNSTKQSFSNSQSPATSIQELHQINRFNQVLDRSEVFFNEPNDFSEPARHRHSEMYSIRQSIGASPKREIRNSLCGMVKKKKEAIPDVWNQSTILNNSRSTLRTQKTFISPKSRMTHCRSPQQSSTKEDPVRLVSLFQKNLAQTILNLSNCGLAEQSLIYFLQKAFASHVPVYLNLSRNRLTQSSFVKIMPYLLKVQTINLASTGLNEGCLDQLLKIKGNRRLEQVNLLDNNISLHRNRQKVDMLKQVGIKIICQ